MNPLDTPEEVHDSGYEAPEEEEVGTVETAEPAPLDPARLDHCGICAAVVHQEKKIAHAEWHEAARI